MAPWVGRAVHRILVVVLAAAMLLQVLRRFWSAPGAVQIAVALACGVVAAWGYGRFAAIRTYLSILAPAPLVFAAAFLFFSQASKLVWPEPLPKVGNVDPPGESTSERPPVVLVVFDELSLPTLMDRTHRIDALRYPNFAALENDSHWFRNATATADNTVLALPAILTGRYLGEGHRKVRLATVTNFPENLFTLLGDGYQMNVFESVTHLCPREVCGSSELDLPAATRLRYLLGDLSAVYLHSLLPADLTSRLPPVNHQWGHFALFVNKKRKRAAWAQIDRKARYISAFQAAIRANPGADLHFLHSGLPHVPWRFLPSGRNYGTKEEGLIGRLDLEQGRWVKDRWLVLQGFQRYLLQQMFVDRLLGDLLGTLKETGLYDRAMVIVTADHGVSFRPGKSRRRVGRQNFPDIMSVPLFIKLPHQRVGTLSDRNVELVDVLPTVVDVLGFEPPWAMDGSSVFDAATSARTKKRIFRSSNKSGGRLAFRVAEMAAKYETTERMVKTFGPSSDPLALYRIGPHPSLVGQPLSELEVAGAPRLRVRLKMPKVFDNVDPETGFIPARVSGDIQAKKLEQPLELAVAVGGTVWATTYTLKTETSKARFTAMVPESAFVVGRNSVEVFVIAGTPDKPRLIPTKP